MKLVNEKKNRSLLFIGDRKIPTLGYTVQWETRPASFSTGTVGPWFWIFLSPLNINDGFYLSHIPVPAHGKDKKRKGPNASQGGCTSVSKNITIHHERPCRIEISHPRGQKFNQGRGLPSPWLNSDPEGEISLSYIDRLMMDRFSPTFRRVFIRT